MKTSREQLEKEKRLNANLLLAAKKNNVQLIEPLIKKGANIETKDVDYGRTPLMIAAENGKTEAMSILLDMGANINARDDYGYTALTNAIMAQEMESIKLLIREKADIETKIKEDFSRTPLMIATEHERTDIIQILIEAKANMEAHDSQDKTALIIAVEKENIESAILLMNGGADTVKPLKIVKSILKNRTKNKKSTAPKETLQELQKLLEEQKEINKDSNSHLLTAIENGDLKYVSRYTKPRTDNKKNIRTLSKHLFDQLNSAIEANSNNEQYPSLKITFKSFLNDNTITTDLNHPTRDYSEIYQIASTIFDVFSKDPKHLIWAEEIAEKKINDGCADQPLLTVAEIATIIPIVQADGTLNKIRATKQHRALNIITNLAQDINKESFYPIPTECLPETILSAYKEVHEELLTERLIPQPWLGAPEQVIVNDDLPAANKHLLQKIASKACEIAETLIDVSDEKLIDYAHGGSLKTAWSLIAFPEEMLKIRQAAIKDINILQESHELTFKIKRSGTQEKKTSALTTEELPTLDLKLSKEEYKKYSAEEKNIIKHYSTLTNEERSARYKEIKDKTNKTIWDKSKALAMEALPKSLAAEEPRSESANDRPSSGLTSVRAKTLLPEGRTR